MPDEPKLILKRSALADAGFENYNVLSEGKIRDAPAFVELGEAGVAVDDATRHQRRVHLVE
jgi:hypothetical protein